MFRAMSHPADTGRPIDADDPDQMPDQMADTPVSFGFRSVSANRKASLVRGVFDSVAPRYDLMNDLMSLGVHRLWKSVLVDTLDPRPGATILDVGGGTGDIAFRILERIESHTVGGAGGKVLVSDINAEMLAVGRDRAADRGLLDRPDWVCGRSEEHTSELQSLMRISYAVFCLKKKKQRT